MGVIMILFLSGMKTKVYPSDIDCSILERDRLMLFPDYYFFAERRLVSHTIETKHVKDLEDCELFCYMNDNCVSTNFKKDPETGGMSHICELNNATHLEYDTDLAINAVFYHRGSKVSYHSNLPACRLTLQQKTTAAVAATRTGNILHSIIRFFIFFRSFSPLISPLLHQILFLLSFRMPVVRIHSAKMMQLVSPVSQSRDIDACALLDSRENIVKKVDFIT